MQIHVVVVLYTVVLMLSPKMLFLIKNLGKDTVTELANNLVCDLSKNVLPIFWY